MSSQSSTLFSIKHSHMAYNITPEYHQVAELDGCEGQKQQLLLNSLLQEPVCKTGIQKCKPLQQNVTALFAWITIHLCRTATSGIWWQWQFLILTWPSVIYLGRTQSPCKFLPWCCDKREVLVGKKGNTSWKIGNVLRHIYQWCQENCYLCQHIIIGHGLLEKPLHFTSFNCNPTSSNNNKFQGTCVGVRQGWK